MILLSGRERVVEECSRQEAGERMTDEGRLFGNLLQGGIFLCIGLIVECRGNEDLGSKFVAAEVFVDHDDRFAAHAFGKLDGVADDATIENRLLAFGGAVEADNLHSISAAGCFECCAGSESRRVIDGEDSSEVRVSLDGISSGGVAGFASTATIQNSDNFHPGGIGSGVVSVNDFAKTFDAQLARFHVRVVDDGHFAAGFTKQFQHGFCSQLSALQVVCGDMANDSSVAAVVLNVIGENRNTGLVGFANGSANAFGVAGVEDNG